MNEFTRRLMDVVSGFDRLQKSDIAVKIEAAGALIVPTLSANKPLLVCGNGGSAADAQHISGELVGRFLLERRALNVISLSSNTAIITAWANDYDYEAFSPDRLKHMAITVVYCCVYRRAAIQRMLLKPSVWQSIWGWQRLA